MKLTKLVTLILLPVSMTGCSSGANDNTPGTDIKLDEKSTEIVNSDNQFGFNLFGTLVENADAGSNLMISPLSISSALSMVLNGANGDTRTQMEQVLSSSGFTTDDINTAYQKLIPALRNCDTSVDLDIANSIWIRESFQVLDKFTETNNDYYDAEVTRLPFDNTAVNQINDWVSRKTHDRIQKMVTSIEPNDVMYLLNAIYFKGSWAEKFDSNATQNKPFTLTDGNTVNVPMMRKHLKLSYLATNKFRMAAFPYGRGKFRMLVMLPNEGVSNTEILQSLDADSWQTYLKGMSQPVELDVWLPKFTFSWEIGLKDVLASLGMPKAFSQSEADFTNINSDGRLYISKVKHKTFIEVNEEGTEAAASTSVTVSYTSVGPNAPIIFHADHPFLFFITEEDTGAILFMGQLSDPRSEN
ncbi:serpin family protein [Prolixibacter denitrificans]|uniref:Serpin B n=2 Tax=Prolixibacter denitrificans TaxID=1541063 RepID=A0A2P8CKB3_9BACT|nr:serpin family protein [Prolixibacter denitrificans]PSK85407.1 serpin B [Prolixibacter denitrificans]